MIKLENLSKEYVSKKDVVTKALADINLTFEDKGMVFIIGKTGCGKSTLLNLLGLLDTPSSGDIIVDGQSIVKQDSKIEDNYRKNYVGFVFQEYNLIEEFTVYENIEVAVKLQGQKVNEEEIDNLLKRFDLYEQKYKLCNELSGGQKQRAAIIRAIVKKPKLILADEPTGALDSKTGEEILNTLKEISKEVLVIVVSHDEDYANRFADRIIEMKDGQIINDSVLASSEQKLDKVDITKVNKKARLSFKEKLKIGLFNFKHRLKKLVLMMFVAMFAFILLGTASTFVTYDKEQIIINSMYENGDDQIFILGTDYYDNYYPQNISSEDVEMFEEKYSRNFYPEFALGEVFNFRHTLAQYNNPTEYYGYAQDGYGIEINEDIAKDLKVELLYGRYPKADDEVMLPESIYQYYIKFGYSFNDITREINTFEDLEGLIIPINNKAHKIVGIIDTGYDKERYQQLDQYNVDNSGNWFTRLKFAHQSYLRSSLNSLIFFNVGYYERNLKAPDNFIKSNNNFFSRFTSPNYGLDETLSFISYSTLDFITDEIVWRDGVERESLADDEIVINVDRINIRTVEIPEGELEILYYEEEELLETSDEYLKSEEYLTYETQLKNQEIDYETFDDLRDRLLERMVIDKLFDKYLWDFYDVGNFSETNLYMDVINKEVKIVGYFHPLNMGADNNVQVVLSNNFFKEFKEFVCLEDYVALFTATTSKSDDLKLIKDINNNEDDIFTVYSRYHYASNSLDNKLQKAAIFMIIGAIVIAVFAGLLFYNYIRYIVDDKRKQIGVLRSLGASKADIASIFLIESLLISLIIASIACALSAVIALILNNYFINSLGLLFKLLSFGIVSVIIVFGVSIIISVITTLIPVANITKKTPIETLRED